MEYVNVPEAARRWGISDRRMRALCAENKIEGVIRKGRGYLIPVDAMKPIDRRTRRGKSISPEALAILDRIDLKKATMDRGTPLPAGEVNQIMKNFLIYSTYHSCSLSGNSFTREDTEKLINGSVIPDKSLKEHLEIIGHRDAFLYVRNLSQNHFKLTERLIKEIHALLMIDRPRDKGTYRRVMASVPGCPYELAPPHLISSQMEELLSEWQKAPLHPVESAVRFHINFELIHPFPDGNGRVGRLLLNLLLMNQGYPAVVIPMADRQRYSQSFAAYQENGSIIPMLELAEQKMVWLK